jgi:hypothetical protein
MDIDFAIYKTETIKSDTGTGHVYNLTHAWISVVSTDICN